MIDSMLIDAVKNGYSAEEIKQAVVEVLKPYFVHEDVLNKFACDSQLLSVFEFFVRYNYEPEFVKGIKMVLDCYKSANLFNPEESWNIILSTYAVMVEDENKMWSIRKEKINLQEEDLYEKMVQIFQKIGNVLEVSEKHIVQELYALICLQNKGYVDYETIRKQDFGVVINNILEQDVLQPVLKLEPCGMKLSDWRNIAYHHTYFLKDNGKVNCTYGKGNKKNLEISMEELERYLYKITRATNIINIARCIFVFDFINDIPKNKTLPKASMRQAIKQEQYRISLLSQQFQLGKVILDKNKIEIDLHDLVEEENPQDRIIHCSQLLLNTWNIWKREKVIINYFSNEEEKICCICVEGNVCESIYEKKEDITYLADKLLIKYF